MARMFWIGGLSLLVILGAVAAGYSWMKGPMYRPGDLRSGKFKAAAPPAQNGATNRWTMEPGIELYHFEEGSGTPLLIVHGGPGFPPEKPWQGGSLLARHYRTIYYHQRGCGNSSRPISRFSTPNMYANMKLLNEQLGLRAQIADIERIRQILGQQKLVLVGHSFGALLVALYAAEYPEHVRAAIFIAPADLIRMPSGKDSDLFEQMRPRIPASERQEYEAYLREYFDFPRAFQRNEEQSAEFYGRMSKFYRLATGINQTAGNPNSTGYEPLALYCSMGQHHDYSAALRRIKAPVLVLHGANDLQPEAASRHFASYFANARFLSIPQATHFVYDDQPQQFASAVENFLSNLSQE
jgi:proline iminopeptidase